MLDFLKTYSNRKFYSQFVGKADLCFDIGANVGKKSRVFLSLGAKVIAFEPQSSCFHDLNRLQIENSQFEYYPYAVGSINEEKELLLANHNEIATLSDKFVKYFTNENTYWNQKEKVIVKTLDTLIESFGCPKFCKIDVEGYEAEILQNLHYKIPIIEFEFTGGFITETISIINHFKGENVTFNFILNEQLHWKGRRWIAADQMIKTIESLPIERLHGNIFVKTVPN